MKAMNLLKEEDLIGLIRTFREKNDCLQCRKCGSQNNVWQAQLKGWICRACKSYLSVRTKTVFEGSHLSLICWLEAAQLMSTNPSKMNASILQRKLGLSRYATAHKLFHSLQNQITIPNAAIEDLISQLCSPRKDET